MVKKLSILGMAIVVIGALVGLYMVIKYSSYSEVDSTYIIEERSSGKVNYTPYQDGVLKFGKDGASYINNKGSIIWTQAFLIHSPRTDVQGDKVVIADLKGTSVFVFDEKGLKSSFDVPYSILDATVAQNGVVAIAMEDKLYSYVHLYDSLGGIIAKSQTSIENDGVPLSIALSQDGTKLATSYLFTEGTKINSRITFYRFDDVGKNHIDKFLGSFSNEDVIIPQIEFMNNNTLAAFANNKIVIYDAEYIPSIKKEIEIREEITAVFVEEELAGIVKKDTINHKYVITMYDDEGSIKGNVSTELELKDVQIGNNEVIVNSGFQWQILNMNGKQKYQGDLLEKADTILAIKKGKYIIVSENKVEEITLK